MNTLPGITPERFEKNGEHQEIGHKAKIFCLNRSVGGLCNMRLDPVIWRCEGIGHFFLYAGCIVCIVGDERPGCWFCVFMPLLLLLLLLLSEFDKSENCVLNHGYWLDFK